jgi:hypothetical protein
LSQQCLFGGVAAIQGNSCLVSLADASRIPVAISKQFGSQKSCRIFHF